MTWPRRVERWREFVEWESKDVPPDLVLGIILNESGGVPGLKSNQAEGGVATVSTADGGEETINHSYGLMQIAPSVVETWNRHHDGAEVALYDDLTGADNRAARMQIRIGCWQFALNVALLSKTFPGIFPESSAGRASSEQLKLALLANATGGNWKVAGTEGRGLRPKLNRLEELGLPLTLEQIKTTFPNWVPAAVSGAFRRWNQYKSAEEGRPAGDDTIVMPETVISLAKGTKKKQKDGGLVDNVPKWMIGVGAAWLLSKFTSGDLNLGVDDEDQEDDQEEEEN